MKNVMLVSGGLDSTIMLMEAAFKKKDCELLYVRCGERYERAEEAHLRKFLAKYNIPYEFYVYDISNRRNDYAGFVPNRNLTLASIACTALGADTVYLAGVMDDNAVDKNPFAYSLMSGVLSKFAQKTIRVESPYSDVTKGQLVERFLRNPYVSKETAQQILLDTYSCYEGENSPCGCCPACFRKYVALESNGISSGITLQKAIIKTYIGKLHTYCKDRISRTLIALRPIFGQVLCFGIDGVLCKEDGTLCFEKKEPIQENIDRVNHSSGLRVIYTSRLESDREVTEKWLTENGVQYDLLLTNEAPFDTLFANNVVSL